MTETSRVRELQRLVLRDTLRAAGKVGVIGFAVWVAAGAVALISLANREYFSAWPEVVKFLLFALVAVSTGPILLVGTGVAWAAIAVIGPDADSALLRAPFVVAGCLLALGVVVALRTASRIRLEEFDRDIARIESARLMARSDSRLSSDREFVESLSPRPEVAHRAKREALTQVLNQWIGVAIVGWLLVAAAIAVYREYVLNAV